MTAEEARQRMKQRVENLTQDSKLQYDKLMKYIEERIDKSQSYITYIIYYEPLDISVLKRLEKEGYKIKETVYYGIPQYTIHWSVNVYSQTDR